MLIKSENEFIKILFFFLFFLCDCGRESVLVFLQYDLKMAKDFSVLIKCESAVNAQKRAYARGYSIIVFAFMLFFN